MWRANFCIRKGWIDSPQAKRAVASNESLHDFRFLKLFGKFASREYFLAQQQAYEGVQRLAGRRQIKIVGVGRTVRTRSHSSLIVSQHSALAKRQRSSRRRLHGCFTI